MYLVDATTFVKLLVDWVVSIQVACHGQQLLSRLPENVYWFTPHAAEQPEDSDALNFALTEMFNYYARAHTVKPKDFTDQQEQLFKLNLRGYVALI